MCKIIHYSSLCYRVKNFNSIAQVCVYIYIYITSIVPPFYNFNDFKCFQVK